MDKKIFSFLFSTRLMAFLFISYAVAMATGTFIESKYNTDTAKILIYNAWWFEAIHLFFLINFIGNIKRYQLLKKEKWATLILHLSFIFIISGAFVTRYISYEGMMPIREGASENQIYSDKTFLTVYADGEYKGEMKRRTFEKEVLLSPVTNNSFSLSENFADTKFEVEYENFIMGAKEYIKSDPKGILYLKIVEAGDGGRHEHFLKEGEVQNIHNVLFSLNTSRYSADINSVTIGSPVAAFASQRIFRPSRPSPWNEYGLVRGLKAPPRSMLAPEAFAAFAISRTWSTDSTEQGPAISARLSPPTLTPDTSMMELSGWKARLANL